MTNKEREEAEKIIEEFYKIDRGSKTLKEIAREDNKRLLRYAQVMKFMLEDEPYKNPNHDEARTQFKKLNAVDGFAMKPNALFKIFYTLLNAKEKCRMNSVKAESMAHVFSALVNEYYILAETGLIDCNVFYMSQSRWDKHNIRRGKMEKAIKRLKVFNLVDYWNMDDNNNPGRQKRMYKINVGMLDLYRVMCCSDVHSDIIESDSA